MFPPDSPGRDLYANPMAGVGIFCCRTLHIKMKGMVHNKRYGSMDMLLELLLERLLELLLVLLLLLLLYVLTT